ncbi:MAG: tellurite resistance TerB family protein [Halioglobus sp.]
MDLNKIMSGLGSSGVLGGFAGGALGGALMSNKKVRKHTGTLLKVGGIAALGGVAWKAYQGYTANQSQQMQSSEQAIQNSGPMPSQSVDANGKWQGLTQEGFAVAATTEDATSPGIVLIHAMVAAGASDGNLDRGERDRIMDRVVKMSLPADEKAMLFDVLDNPLSLSELVQEVNCPELAAEVYLCSVIVLDQNRIESQLYLEALAHRLEIPAEFAGQLRDSVEKEYAQVA